MQIGIGLGITMLRVAQAAAASTYSLFVPSGSDSLITASGDTFMVGS